MTLRPEIITVFGGSGFVGRYVVRELCKQGFRVRVAVRYPHSAQDLKVAGEPGQIQLLQANVRNRPSVERAVEGAWGVVNLVGILFEEGRQKFASTQSRGAQLIAEAAAADGVQRFVHVSAIGADENSESSYARTKAQGEMAVRDAFPQAAIVRPSIVFGADDDFFNKFAAMTRLSPALPLIGGGKTKFQPVYAGDVATAIAGALTRDDAAGKLYELGGPRVYSFKELMQTMLKVIDRKRALIPVPFFAAGPMGVAGGIVGALPFIQPPITADQVKLLKSDNVVTDSDAVGTIEDLGVTRMATVESILPTYLFQYRHGGQFHEVVPDPRSS